MKKSLAVLLALGVSSLAFGRVGPVSQYGQLMTGKNAQGQGRIYGSCEGVKAGSEVQVRGMSLYWSMVPRGTEFWTAEGISTMVRDMNIQIVRAAMGTTSDDWWGCKDGSESCGDDKSKHITGYATDAEFQTNLMNTVVQAAIDNDIYVIIDWHSHQAHEEVANATKFFTEMAQKWGKYDHVIFELFNEPKEIEWSTVKSYAEKIVPVIRQYSDNLILVGNPMWDQNPQYAIGNTVSGDNIAYTFHYYANSHCWNGQTEWGTQCEGDNAQQAINAGLSVFVSEWGTGNSDGGGNPNVSRNTSWQNWMDDNQLSWANWSASKVDEGTAAFQGSSNRYGLSYTTSGNLVKGYLASNPSSYTKCSNTPSSSSSGSSSASSEVALIDNFEDGNTTVETVNNSFWFLYTANGGSISNTAPASDDEPWDMIRSSASNHYAAMEGISIGSPTSNQYPSTGMGMALAAGSFANCTAIQYDYRGTGHYFRADMNNITPNKGYEHVTENQNKSDSWKTVTVNASKLFQPQWVRQDTSLSNEVKDFSWNKVYQLVWVFDKSIASAQRATYLQIDNVKCVGTLPEVVVASSSSGTSPASSSSQSSVESSASITSSTDVATSIIDDFEDGNNFAFTGLEDYWYVFTDNGDNGASTVSNSLNDLGDYNVVFLENVGGNTNYYAGAKGIVLDKGENRYDPYVTLGVNIEAGLKGCNTLYYRYRGATHNLKVVMEGDEDGFLTDYNYHKVAVNGSSSWKKVSIPVSSLKQDTTWGTIRRLNIADVVKVQWEVIKTANFDYLYVDDFGCEGMSIVPVVVPDEDESSSSRVTSRSSSSAKESVSSSSAKESGSSSSAKESGSSSSAKSSSSRYGDDEDDDDNEPETVESLDDVKCTSKKEGEIITVAEEDADYYCYKKEWIEIVSSTKKLPNCTAKREGLSIYVERADEVVTCEDEEWLSVDDDRTAIASGVDRLAGLSASIHGNTLQVTVAKAGLVKIQVFDMMGHAIESHSESMAAGSFAHTFGSMGKGAYIVRVQQGSMAKTIRMQVQ